MSTSENHRDHPRDEKAGARCLYEVLDLIPGASAAEIARAHARSVALVDGSALGGYAMLDPESALEARVEIDEARRILLDATLRAAYDTKKGYPPAREQSAEGPVARAVSPASAAAESTPPASISKGPASGGRTSSLPSLRILTPVVTEEESPAVSRESEHPSSGSAQVEAKVDIKVAASGAVATDSVDDTLIPVAASPVLDNVAPPVPVEPAVIDGDAIRRMREARGVTLEALAAETHIRRNFLVAIEAMAWADLPERVFVRGFLTQIARVLRADAKLLVDGYLSHDTRRRGP
jgi:hypothetical protein